MRAQAQGLSSAANRDGSAHRGSVFGRRDAATRASSLSVDGSGAPSHRGRLAALALAIAAFALLAFAPLAGAKEVFTYFGNEVNTGTAGGEFANFLGDSAANGSGVGAPAGTIYVSDAQNHRIQRFDRDFRFVSAWGKDTIAASVDERQRLLVVASGGSFSITFDGSTTASIPYDASAATVDNALDALFSVGGDANVDVVGGPQGGGAIAPYFITLRGALAARDLSQIAVDAAKLDGSARVSTIADGLASVPEDTGTGFEVCTIASHCKGGTASGGSSAADNGSMSDPQSVAVDGDTGNVYVADRNNRRIDAYDASGNFIAAYGWNVVATGSPDNAAEFQRVTVDATGGTFTLAFGAGAPTVTDPLDYNASAATIQARLEALGDIGAGNIKVSGPDGGPWVVRFVGALSNTNVASLVTDATLLTGDNPNVTGAGPTAAVTEVLAGAQANNYEICDGAVDACQAGSGGNGAGRIGTDLNSAGGIAVSPVDSNASTGTVFLADGGNRRVVTYSLDGTNFSSFGSATQFGTGSGSSLQFPREVAVDSRGIVYASNSKNGAQIERYDSAGVNGPVGFLAPITPGAGSLLPTDNVLSATDGLGVDPDSDSGGPDEDVLYVLRDPDPGLGSPVVQQFGPVNDPGQVAAPTAEDAHHGAEASICNFGGCIEGFGLDDSSGRLFISSTQGLGGLAAGARVYVLGDSLAAPRLTIDPVSAVTDTTAAFSGSVDPNGGLVRCTFQYATDPGFASPTGVAVPACLLFSPNGGFQPVGAGASGLKPNTHYYARLVVSRPFDSSSSATSSLLTFTTDAPPPVVSNTGAVDIADTSARLVATIDPRNNPTGYVFEYGTTPALGSSTAPLNIGGGTTPITVSQLIGGLSPDTDYYLRAVATNTVGTTQGSTQTFHTRTDPLPPAGGRAYEQVSPVDKNYGDVDSGVDSHNTAGASLDGNAVGFTTVALFGDPPGRLASTQAPYISRRTAGGWVTPTDILPEFCKVDPVSGSENGAIGIVPSADFSHLLIRKQESVGCPIPPLAPNASLGTDQPFLNFYLQEPSEPPSYSLLNPESVAEVDPGYAGGSDDFSHVVYQSNLGQTADAPAGDFRKLYQWVQPGPDCGVADPSYDATIGACLSLISKDPDNEAFATFSSSPAKGQIGGRAIQLPNAVSGDGERVYFANSSAGLSSFGFRDNAQSTCNGPACQVYMREHGQRAPSPQDVDGDCTDPSLACTFDVSASECTVDCGAPQDFADQFISATPSGAHAFFESGAKLTDASSPSSVGVKLYRWDRNAAPGNRLADLTVDHEPSDGVQPGFIGLIGQSDDGDTAYFVTTGQIVAGEPTAIGGKLYRWQWNGGTPAVDYIGPYQSQENAFGVDANWFQLNRQVSADGRYLLVFTKLGYVAGDVDGDADVYRWDEQRGWACASCQAPGAPSAGNIDVWEAWMELDKWAFFDTLGTLYQRISMSDDGQRIFFGTPDALVPEDTNGESGCPFRGDTGFGGASDDGEYACEDVYEWHDGTLNLVSSGTGTAPSRLIGASSSGRDVFFWTRDRLVGWDIDNNTDIYDARLGGGFPEPPPVPPPCDLNSGACEGPASVGADVPGAGSARFEGQVNPPQPRPCPRGKRRVTRNGRTRCVPKKHRRGNRAAKHNRRAAR